jgi:hypothetical protein
VARPTFAPSDAWVLLAVIYAGEPADRQQIIAAGDHINHAIFMDEELEGGLRRLREAELIVESERRFTPSKEVQDWYKMSGPRHRRVDRDLERVERLLEQLGGEHPSARVAFDSPANAGIMRYLGRSHRVARSVSVARDRPECAPSEVIDPSYTLGTHPDLVARLWDELGGTLPEDCRWVVHGSPALVHPATGVIFAFAGGTHTYAFRLPPDCHAEALAAGATTVVHYPAYPEIGASSSTLDLTEIGPEWGFGGWHAGEDRWCRAAYAFAGETLERRLQAERPNA